MDIKDSYLLDQLKYKIKWSSTSDVCELNYIVSDLIDYIDKLEKVLLRRGISIEEIED